MAHTRAKRCAYGRNKLHEVPQGPLSSFLRALPPHVPATLPGAAQASHVHSVIRTTLLAVPIRPAQQVLVLRPALILMDLRRALPDVNLRWRLAGTRGRLPLWRQKAQLYAPGRVPGAESLRSPDDVHDLIRLRLVVDAEGHRHQLWRRTFLLLGLGLGYGLRLLVLLAHAELAEALAHLGEDVLALLVFLPLRLAHVRQQRLGLGVLAVELQNLVEVFLGLNMLATIVVRLRAAKERLQVAVVSLEDAVAS
mmetsp:Transcript_9934/g.21075  ORF Transcript_9934/g.21075 Transcript_9934/m.21075 type:complete len:252 (+) Transcript_9934:194-949(+)